LFGTEKEIIMKKQAFYILTALVLITGAAISQAYGQRVYSSTFNIPFDFSVRGKAFPAGSYTVGRAPGLNADMFMIRSEDGNQYALCDSMPKQLQAAPEQSQLVFSRCGNSYRLREVRTAGLATGREVLRTKRERSLERELEATGTKVEPVVIAAAR
jgi:hypothetical protein